LILLSRSDDSIVDDDAIVEGMASRRCARSARARGARRAMIAGDSVWTELAPWHNVRATVIACLLNPSLAHVRAEWLRAVKEST
jgi:hypothetical protein